MNVNKLEPNKKYIYHSEDGSFKDFEVTYVSEEKESLIFNCSRCGKEVTHYYYFCEYDSEGNETSNYCLGSECIKKIIKEIKE